MSKPHDDRQDDLFRPPLKEIINLRLQRRFEFVRNYHSLNARIAPFAEFIRGPHQYEIGGDNRVRQWINWK